MAFIYIHVWVHLCIPRYLFPQLVLNYCRLSSFTNKVEARQNTTAKCMQATDSGNFATKDQPKRSMYVDNKRKREQRLAAKRTEQEEACRIAPMRPLTSFFARRNYDEITTSPLPGAAEDLDASLLDVNEELDIALRDIQQQAAVRNYATTKKERVGHLIRCLETKKGVNTARAYQHAIAFRQFETCIRVKGMSELQAGRFVAETCYGDNLISAMDAPMLLPPGFTAIVPVLSSSDIATF
jgi:hypothetical protein